MPGQWAFDTESVSSAQASTHLAETVLSDYRDQVRGDDKFTGMSNADLYALGQKLRALTDEMIPKSNQSDLKYADDVLSSCQTSDVLKESREALAFAVKMLESEVHLHRS